METYFIIITVITIDLESRGNLFHHHYCDNYWFRKSWKPIS